MQTPDVIRRLQQAVTDAKERKRTSGREHQVILTVHEAELICLLWSNMTDDGK